MLNGNDILLSGNIGFRGANPAAPITQTVNHNMAWSANKTVEIRLGATWADTIGLAVSNLLPPNKTTGG